MGLLGLSLNTESAHRSAGGGCYQNNADRSTVWIRQYCKREGTVFGVFACPPLPRVGAGDPQALSPSSSGVSSAGSSYQGCPEHRKHRGRSTSGRSASVWKESGKEQSPGSDYGSLVSEMDIEESLKLTGRDCPVFKLRESPRITEREFPNQDEPPRRRQRQRSASESISDKLSESHIQRDKGLEDLWPESNSLDRNTSQYGNNAVAIRGVKLQQSDTYQNGCQGNNAVVVRDAEIQDLDIFNNAVAKRGSKLQESDVYDYKCQSCQRKSRLTSPTPHTLHPHNPKPKHPSSLLPKTRSLFVPRRPSFTDNRLQQRHTDPAHCSGNIPETPHARHTKGQSADINKSTTNSEERHFLSGLIQNKCNISTELLYSSCCHGNRNENAGVWTSGCSTSRSSSCCLNVVQGCTQHHSM